MVGVDLYVLDVSGIDVVGVDLGWLLGGHSSACLKVEWEERFD